MSEIHDYHRAMLKGDTATGIAIEQRHGLFGYPPELVTVGLHAIARGLNPHHAIDDYIANAEHDKA